METKRYKPLTIHTIQILGEGSYSFIGEIYGFQVVFEQWDNGPIEFDKEAFKEHVGNGIHMLPQHFFDFMVKLATPEIEQVKYYDKLIKAFSEN